MLENNETNTQTLDLNDALFDLDVTENEVSAVKDEDDPDSRFKSWSLCTFGCAHTGSFNSFCC